MGISGRQACILMGLVVILFAIAVIGHHFEISAQEPNQSVKQAAQGWRVETFVESSDSPDAVDRLCAQLCNHLNEAKTASDVKLLLSYKYGGAMLATLVYRLDTAEHHYVVRLHKLGTTSERNRSSMKEELEKLLNTSGVSPHCLAQEQEAITGQAVFGVVVEVK